MPTLVRGLKTLADWLIHSIHTSSTYYMPYTLAGIVDRRLSKKKPQKLLPYGAYVLVISQVLCTRHYVWLRYACPFTGEETKARWSCLPNVSQLCMKVWKLEPHQCGCRANQLSTITPHPLLKVRLFICESCLLGNCL